MKRVAVLNSPAARTVARLGLVSVALLLGGCFGRQLAVDLTGRMTAASTAALSTTAALKNEEAAVVAGYNAGLKAHADLADSFKANATKLVAVQAELAYQTQVAAVETLRADAINRLARMRGGLMEQAFTDLEASWAPWRKKIEGAFVRSSLLKEESEKFKGDAVRELAWRRAELAYLAAAGDYNAHESDSRRELVQRIDAGFVAEFDRLNARATEIQKALADKLTAAKSAASTTKWPELKFGEPMTANTAAYESLAAYIGAVKAGGEGLDLYLRLNSLGKGSFIEAFTSAFFKNLLPSAVQVAAGKFTEWKDVDKSLRAVADPAVSEAKKDFEASTKDLMDSFRSEAKAATDSFEAAAKKKITDTVKEQVGKLAEKIKLP